jgi:glutathione synthase/RimK-type ligase-like ATP-grasp enzyme
MKLAIHSSKNSFSESWIAYCEEKHIPVKIVDCYKSDIMQQMADCDALMWHFSQNSPKAILFAKQLIYSIEAGGKKVFPCFYTSWHFDDKVGQKYLLEAVGAPVAPTWIFYDKHEALQWTSKTDFPKVFKLRCGAGSQNVRLVRTRNEANKLIYKAFGRGFPAYDAVHDLKERYRLYRLGKTNFRDLLEAIVRFVLPPPYSRVRGHENGYIYFQKYITGNNHDIRVIVIRDKALAIKRMVRENDFRASGSGEILYDRSMFDEKIIRLSLDLAAKLKTQCVAFDYVNDNGKPLVVEISYGFSPGGYEPCPGYWDKELNWHDGKFNPYGWMIEDLIRDLEAK